MSNLFDFFKGLFNKNDSGEEDSSESEVRNPTIRVIGPRSSGKTVYLASLARWPNANPSSPIQSVIPVNDNGEKLIEQAKNLLEQGEQLSASTVAQGVKDYNILIKLKEQFSWNNALNRNTPQIVGLNVYCKDYPGEFFQDIVFQSGTELLQEYLQDCSQAEGILLLIDGTGHRQDQEFANGLQRFLVELDRIENSNGLTQRRIALVVTKCEQPELWVNRYQPKKIVHARFREVIRHLDEWDSAAPGNVEYFTASAFGMVGNRYPKPNMKLLKRGKEGITAAVLKYPDRWQPFGLVAPIYWLCTGKRHEILDKE